MYAATAAVIFLLQGGTAGDRNEAVPQSPVIQENLQPAARARIGERGLYNASLTRLPDGTLLVCAHYGRSEAPQLSLWLSDDQGANWKRVQTRGDALFGAGAALKTLQDGSVLLHTGVLYRSQDRGITWERVDGPDVGAVRSIVEQGDGTVSLFGSETSWHAGWETPPSTLSGKGRAWYREGAEGHVVKRRAWRSDSSDGGRSWTPQRMILDEDVPIHTRTNWTETQSLMREASILTLSRSHWMAAVRRSDPEEQTVLMESRDGGVNWTRSQAPLPSGALHGHLLALQDGRLLCTYTAADVPRGIFAVLSHDQGKSWGVHQPIYLAGSMADPFGWPTSIQLPDSSVVTVYTTKAYEETTQIHDSVTEVVRWKPPHTPGSAVQPLSAPLFAESHDYSRYPSAVTGFTGGDLQQISFWEYVPAERAQIPGYKGALARFPDGELLATPFQQGHSVIYRSPDDGRSWTQGEMRGDPIPGKEQAMICLRDNKTVLLQTEAKETPLFRSTDRGVTWARVEYGEATGTMRTFVELSDGSVLMFGSAGQWVDKPECPRSRAWILRSVDSGRTWPERKEVKTWDSPARFFSELFVLPLSDTHFLAATRVDGDIARQFAGAPPIEVGKGAGSETDEAMVLMESHDGGVTWSDFRTFLGYSAVHVHMIKLQDGRLLAVYRRRFLPYGVGAVISADNGKTWDVAHPLIVGVRPSCFGGWPTSLQLRDGTILTTRAFMTWPDALFEATRWEVPGTGR